MPSGALRGARSRVRVGGEDGGYRISLRREVSRPAKRGGTKPRGQRLVGEHRAHRGRQLTPVTGPNEHCRLAGGGARGGSGERVGQARDAAHPGRDDGHPGAQRLLQHQRLALPQRRNRDHVGGGEQSGHVVAVAEEDRVDPSAAAWSRRLPASGPAPAMTTSGFGSMSRQEAAASSRMAKPFCGASRPAPSTIGRSTRCPARRSRPRAGWSPAARARGAGTTARPTRRAPAAASRLQVAGHAQHHVSAAGHDDLQRPVRQARERRPPSSSALCTVTTRAGPLPLPLRLWPSRRAAAPRVPARRSAHGALIREAGPRRAGLRPASPRGGGLNSADMNKCRPEQRPHEQRQQAQCQRAQRTRAQPVRVHHLRPSRSRPGSQQPPQARQRGGVPRPRAVADLNPAERKPRSPRHSAPARHGGPAGP